MYLSFFPSFEQMVEKYVQVCIGLLVFNAQMSAVYID
jgi:hypothetical protein